MFIYYQDLLGLGVPKEGDSLYRNVERRCKVRHNRESLTLISFLLSEEKGTYSRNKTCAARRGTWKLLSHSD